VFIRLCRSSPFSNIRCFEHVAIISGSRQVRWRRNEWYLLMVTWHSWHLLTWMSLLITVTYNALHTKEQKDSSIEWTAVIISNTSVTIKLLVSNQNADSLGAYLLPQAIFCPIEVGGWQHYTTTIVLRPPGLCLGLPEYQKGKTRKIKPIWIYWCKR